MERDLSRVLLAISPCQCCVGQLFTLRQTHWRGLIWLKYPRKHFCNRFRWETIPLPSWTGMFSNQMSSYLFFQEQSPELWFGFWNCTGGAALLHTWFVHWSTDVPIAVSAFWHCCVLSGLKSYPESKWLVAWKQATLKGADWKSENIERRWNRPFARVGHMVQNRTCCKLQSGQDGLVRVALCWKSHNATCVPACVIFDHVTGWIKVPMTHAIWKSMWLIRKKACSFSNRACDWLSK